MDDEQLLPTYVQACLVAHPGEPLEVLAVQLLPRVSLRGGGDARQGGMASAVLVPTDGPVVVPRGSHLAQAPYHVHAFLGMGAEAHHIAGADEGVCIDVSGVLRNCLKGRQVGMYVGEEGDAHLGDLGGDECLPYIDVDSPSQASQAFLASGQTF